jgi:uncharacterized protein YutE (UPF0331/DUF86 family)
MRSVPLNRKVIEARLNEIKIGIQKLKEIKKFTISEFKEGENFAIAEHYLRRTLEAMFNIGNHILSRLFIPQGERPSTYKGIAITLGKYKVIPKEFADTKLKDMVGYRSRLVHFYYEITKQELYHIIQNNLEDIEFFAKNIVSLLKEPKKIGLSIK